MSSHGVAIRGVGYALPEMAVGNDHELFQGIPDIPENWWRFWGIESRYRVGAEGSELSLAVEACRRAMDAARIAPGEVDLVLSNTTNFYVSALPDEEMAQAERKRLYPRLSYSLARALETDRALYWEVEAACASFLFNLQVAANFIKQGRYRTVLVCAAEQMSAMLDYTSKSSTTFGDGAAAAVLTRAAVDEADLLASCYYSDSQPFQVATGRWRYPENLPLERRRPDDFSVYFTLAEDGQAQIARMMPETVPKVTLAALKKAGLCTDDIKAFVFHQPSVVLVDTWAKRLGVDAERYETKLADCGCLVSASVAVTLCETVAKGKLAPGDLMVMAGAGAGWSFGAQVWRIGEIASSAAAAKPETKKAACWKARERVGSESWNPCLSRRRQDRQEKIGRGARAMLPPQSLALSACRRNRWPLAKNAEIAKRSRTGLWDNASISKPLAFSAFFARVIPGLS